MDHWIFVTSDTDEGFARKMVAKKWPIFVYTPNRNNLGVADKVIFYKTGILGKKFIGSAKIDSTVEKKGIDYSLNLSDIVVWSDGVDVRPLLNKLGFIKNKTYWGLAFQGGVKRISENDYNVIVKSVNNQSPGIL